MLLKVEDLSIAFQTKKGLLEAVRDISFELSLGQTLGVVGESGCGKSITNLALMGLLPDTAQVSAKNVNFDGLNLFDLKESQWQKIRGKEISMIFQDPMSALNPSFKVGFQIEESLKIHEPTFTSMERKKRVISLLGQVGIPAPEERINSYAHELSGGMSQRVMIAMAIACKPKLLIADEPTTALDVTIQKQILQLLKDLQEQYEMAMIFVTHDLGVVANIADHIQVMYAGEIVESGAKNRIIHHAHHPYTSGLLSSLPGSQTPFRGKLPSIAGIVPDLFSRPEGCQFAPRCDYKSEKCQAHPPLETREVSRIRCFHPINEESLK